jgi:hypothetical protein
LGAVVASSSFEILTVSFDELSYGLEASYALGPNTTTRLSATLGSVDFNLLTTELDTWNVDLGIAHYITPTLKIAGEVGIGGIEDFIGDDDTVSLRLGGEWQPFSVPLSLLLEYSHFELDAPALAPTTDLDVDTFTVSLRWSWGGSGGSLQDRDTFVPFDTRTGLMQRNYDIR